MYLSPFLFISVSSVRHVGVPKYGYYLNNENLVLQRRERKIHQLNHRPDLKYENDVAKLIKKKKLKYK